MSTPPLQTPSIWDSTMEEALIRLLLHSPQGKMRVRAAQELAKNPSPAAVDALTYVSLLSESAETREAARMGLDLIYGEDAERVIEEYRKNHDIDETLPLPDETEEAEEEENEPPSPFTQSQSSFSPPPPLFSKRQEPVMEKVGIPSTLLILIAIAAVFVLGAAAYLFLVK